MINYKDESYASNIVYVGDVETADKILVTYYDTPLSHFGSYYFFDTDKQKKSTISKLVVNFMLTATLGVIGLLIYMNAVVNPFDLKSVFTYIVIGIFALYFYYMGKVTRGLSVRSTLVRNTSSVIYMLKMISEEKNSSTAYAFVDNGAYGEAGLNIVNKSVKKEANIFYLDSLGANQKMHTRGRYFDRNIKSKNNINYIFSARYNDESDHYYLEKEDILQKDISDDNYEVFKSLIK